jgi:hypothetical protein
MPGMKAYREGGKVRDKANRPAVRRENVPTQPRGRTEEEVLRDRSGVSPLLRDGMMREGDRTPDRGPAGMMNPDNFSFMNEVRERRRTEGVRLKGGGIVKKAVGGMVTHMGPGSGNAPPAPGMPQMGRRIVQPGGGSGNPNAVGRQPPVNPGRMQPRPMPAPPGGGLRAALGSIPTNSNRTQSNPGGGNPDAVGRQMPAPPGGGRPMPGGPRMKKGGMVKKKAGGMVGKGRK